MAYEGFVNQVDNGSAANKAGLLKGSRIVAIQSRPLSKLSHKDMIDILRSESRVSLRVLPPVGNKERVRKITEKSYFRIKKGQKIRFFMRWLSFEF